MTDNNPDHSGSELISKAKEEVPFITCEEYKALQKSGKEHIVLDVREPDEFEKGHVEGAINIPRGLLEVKVEEAIPDREANIIICCQSGGRAALGGETLFAMGYENVRNLEGGFGAWCQE